MLSGLHYLVVVLTFAKLLTLVAATVTDRYYVSGAVAAQRSAVPTLSFTAMKTNNLLAQATLTASESIAATQAARQREVDNALLVQALCERRPSPGVVARLMRYVTGELSREQAFAELYVGMV